MHESIFYAKAFNKSIDFIAVYLSYFTQSETCTTAHCEVLSNVRRYITAHAYESDYNM